jgi:hypothetical protein
MMELHTNHSGPIVSEEEHAEATGAADLEGRAAKRGGPSDP